MVIRQSTIYKEKMDWQLITVADCIRWECSHRMSHNKSWSSHPLVQRVLWHVGVAATEKIICYMLK